MAGRQSVATDGDLYVAPVVGTGYLDVDGSSGDAYEIPERASDKHRGPVIEDPAFRYDGFGASSTDAYEIMDPPETCDECVRLREELARCKEEVALMRKSTLTLPSYVTVFRHPKYVVGIPLCDSPPQLQVGREVNAAGEELREAIRKVTVEVRTALFNRQFWVVAGPDNHRYGNSGPIGWWLESPVDGNYQGKPTPRREPILQALRAAQKPACHLVDLVQSLTEQIFPLISLGDGDRTVEAVEADPAMDVQPVPACFQRHRSTGLGSSVPWEELPTDVRDVFKRAREALRPGAESKVALMPHIIDRGIYDMVCYGHYTYFNWLLSSCVLQSADFHGAMAHLLSRFGEYIPAPMKGTARIFAKSNEETGDYVDLPGHTWPLCKYVKDILRGSVLVDDHSRLAVAVRALTEAYAPASIKNRLGEPTRDVLVVVRFGGLLVEVQFHFQPVLVLKTLSHVGFNLSRMQTKDGRDLYTMYSYSLLCYDDLLGVKEEDVKCKFAI